MNLVTLSDRLSKLLMILAATLTFAVSFLVLADIIGRGAFNFPIHGTAEMVAAAIVIIVSIIVIVQVIILAAIGNRLRGGGVTTTFGQGVQMLWIAAIVSWLVAFKIVNTASPLVHNILKFLYQITEPALRPIRRIKLVNNLYRQSRIDISPVLLLFGLFFLKRVLMNFLDALKTL